MPLAYITSDRSGLKFLNVLQANFPEVHFYFVNPKCLSLDLCVEELPLMTERLLISQDEVFRTEKQTSVLKKNEKILNLFLNDIYNSKIVEQEPLPDSLGAKHQEFDVDDISFINYSSEKFKYVIQNSRIGNIEYDFVLFQNTQMATSALLGKQQNIFHSFTEQTKAVMTLIYQIDWAHKSRQEDSEFIFIENDLLSSVEDNWYFTKILGNKLEISFIFPIDVQKSEEYLNFVSGRVITLFNQKFIAFKISQLLESFVLPIDGFYNHQLKLRNSKNAALVPAYTFWPHKKASAHLQQILKSKSTRLKKEKQPTRENKL